MPLTVAYGRKQRVLDLPPGVHPQVLSARTEPSLAAQVEQEMAARGARVAANLQSAVVHALLHPIGTPRLREIVHPGERVAIIVNDITRLVHSEWLLPPLLDELAAAGVPDDDVFVVFANGTHRAQSRQEQEQIVGPEIARRLRLYDHDSRDAGNLVSIGTTSRGNQVWINRRVFEADRVILTGEIIFHLIAGYSGGRKSLIPGVAGHDTATRNHSLILDPRCESGRLEGNPAHEDLLEACRLFPPDFLLNVVLSPVGQLLKAVAGDVEQAHREGCRFVDQVYRVELDQPFDVVIASAGGFPLDIDLRQAHKGMESACRALRDGGALIYFAECADGSGSRACEEWARKFRTAGEMERHLREQFQIGAHKAYWLARLAEKYRIYLVSQLPDALVTDCRLTPCHDPQATLDALLGKLGSTARVAFIPCAGFVLPSVSHLSGVELVTSSPEVRLNRRS